MPSALTTTWSGVFEAMPLDSSTRVLAIRHGETAWNRDKRIQGQLDVPLNETGRAQAQRLGEVLAGESVDVVYSSDLGRARETAAAAAAALGQPVHLDPGLRERSFGVFQGQTWQEIAERWPDHSERWRRRDPDFGAEGGETLQEFYARSVSAVECVLQRHAGQTVLIVTHGGVLDCLYRAATRLPLQAPRTWTLGNAAINRLLFSDAGFTLVGWNDDAHLGGLGLDELA
ncbi:histidine phosphatase family protein [Paucibacter sp. B51]|uniref:histidine phosphatase family protein n=1 Tax=Paucibacter sp. B51 TaxID=2993315 RepID=UPI0022EBBDD8|nr:histidine phosphatase family protein [Paucibacter sp. B51]